MNRESLFSEHWHRVRDLKPRLASDVAVRCHRYRGVPSYVLHRRSTGAYHRLDAQAFALISLLDGTVSIDSAWQRAIETQGEDAPGQPQVLGLLTELHEAELLSVDRALDAEQLFARSRAVGRRDVRQRYLSPLFLRFRLIDPDRFLNAIRPVAHALFGRSALLVWSSLVVFAAVLLLPRWDELRYEIAGFDPFSAASIGLFLMLYPALKLLHELGHALALKRLGGEVHELGIALMVFLPVPYVDASAASILPSKRDRMLVGAAGILVELGVAAAAAVIWTLSSGPVHDVALLVMLVGGLSTLLVNGNPLLKFDGYYVLSDAIEIPNLADRSRRYLTGVASRSLFRVPSRAIAPVDRAERLWLIGYGTLSTLYRFVLLGTIALMVSERFFLLGMALALWIVVSMIGLPLRRFLVFLMREPTLSRPRAVLISTASIASVLAVVLWLPLPLNTVVQGVVWLPDNAIVRTQHRCEVTQILTPVGRIVRPGDPLFDCTDERLVHERAIAQARLDELAARRAGLELSARVEYERIGLDLSTLETRLARIDRKLARQRITAAATGRFHPSLDTLIDGRFLAAGEAAAYVIPTDARTVRVAMTQTDATWYHRDVADVELRFDEQAGHRRTYRSTVQRETPQATQQVPSAALTTYGGGRVVADPTGDGRQALQPVFDLELAWPADAPPVNVGSHVTVVFHHDPTPLVERVVTSARRAFQGGFDT